MDWFTDFYENDYFHYRYAPRLEEVPQNEVDFIIRHGTSPDALNSATRPGVLDICCGTGRHARPLAKAGCDVLGVDLSNPNIEAATKLARQDGVSEHCRFVQGDIRQFDPPARYDLAINIFTSFGYFEDEKADSIIFSKACEALRPGGRFILDIANREKIVAQPPKTEKRGDENNYVIDEPSFDLRRSRLTCKWTFVRDGKSSQHTIRIRLYSLHELMALAGQFDMEVVDVRGDFDDSPYTADSRRCIFIARKK